MKLKKMNHVIMVLLLFTLILGQSSLAFAAKPGGGTTTYIPPTITQGDVFSLTVEEGKTINFTLNATGTNYTSFAWSNTTTTNASITKSNTTLANGNSQVTFTYLNNKPVTSDTFTVRVTDVKKKNTFDTIRINVTITKPLDLQVPVIVVAPTISGTFYPDELLTANPGTWTDASLPLTYIYQWMVDNAPVSNVATYTPGIDTIGKSVTLSVQAVDNAGNVSARVTSPEYVITERPIITTFDYVVLGDSIPNGVCHEYELKGNILSYTDMLDNYFRLNNANATYTDLSVSGFNSIDIIYQLENLEIQEIIKNAEVITLCIGSNDLMDAANDGLFGTINFYSINWTEANSGRANFEMYWPQIIQKISELNPNVSLMVTTIYNPYNTNDSRPYNNVGLEDQSLNIHEQVDLYLWNELESKKGMNNIIFDYAITGPLDYQVIDVNRYFENNFGTTMDAVTGFYGLNPIMGFIELKDPHPDKTGQQLIYELHLDSLNQVQ